MDPGTGLTILGATVGSAKVIEKILGPTAEYVGEGLRGWTEQRVENAGAVLKRLANRLGGSLDEPAGIPPRVFLPAIAEASTTEDPLVQEYFAGVLASSRTPNADDDSGVFYLNILRGLPASHVRFHYVVYASLHRWVMESKHYLGSREDRQFARLFAGTGALAFAVHGDAFNEAQLVSHGEGISVGLSSQRLIEPDGNYTIDGAGRRRLERDLPGGLYSFPTPGLVVTPSALGINLYTWAHGEPEFPFSELAKLEAAAPSDAPSVEGWTWLLADLAGGTTHRLPPRAESDPLPPR